MATKRNPILDKLGKSMDRTNKTKTTPPKPPDKPTGGGKCRRTGVSLYDDDMQRINDIKVFMMHQGMNNVNQAEVIRAALRAAPLDQSIIDALLATRADDGRGS